MPPRSCHGPRQLRQRRPTGCPPMRKTGAVPRPLRSRPGGSSVPHDGGRRRRVEASGTGWVHPRVARWGVLGRVVSPGPRHHQRRAPTPTGTRGPGWPRGGVPGRDRTRGRKRKNSQPEEPGQNDEGRRENTPDALRIRQLDSDAARARRTRPVGPVRRRARGWPGVDSLDGSSLSDLAAGHLQGPARTRTTYTDHLLSLVIRKIAPRADVP